MLDSRNSRSRPNRSTTKYSSGRFGSSPLCLKVEDVRRTSRLELQIVRSKRHFEQSVTCHLQYFMRRLFQSISWYMRNIITPQRTTHKHQLITGLILMSIPAVSTCSFVLTHFSCLRCSFRVPQTLTQSHEAAAKQRQSGFHLVFAPVTTSREANVVSLCNPNKAFQGGNQTTRRSFNGKFYKCSCCWLRVCSLFGGSRLKLAIIQEETNRFAGP